LLLYTFEGARVKGFGKKREFGLRTNEYRVYPGGNQPGGRLFPSQGKREEKRNADHLSTTHEKEMVGTTDSHELERGGDLIVKRIVPPDLGGGRYKTHASLAKPRKKEVG